MESVMFRKRKPKQLYYSVHPAKDGTAILFPSYDKRDEMSLHLKSLGIDHTCRWNTKTIDVPVYLYKKHKLHELPGYVAAWTYVHYVKLPYLSLYNSGGEVISDEVIEACKVRTPIS